MFDLGIQEIIVIMVVALIVFGPKRLPEIGQTLGKAMNEFRKTIQGAKEQMDTEMKDIKEPFRLDQTGIPSWKDAKQESAAQQNTAQTAPDQGIPPASGTVKEEKPAAPLTDAGPEVPKR